jgi:hypothetical protein
LKPLPPKSQRRRLGTIYHVHFFSSVLVIFRRFFPSNLQLISTYKRFSTYTNLYQLEY